MNKVGRVLLIGGGIVLALLVGLLIGRSRPAEPVQGNATTVQITTLAPASPSTPAAQPLPPPAAPPPPAVVAPKVAPDAQVQEDAAAVGMTTQDDNGEAAKSPAASTDAPAPQAPPY